MDPTTAMQPYAADPDLSWLQEEDDALAIGFAEDDDYVEADPPKGKEALALAEELKGAHALYVGQTREMDEAYDGDHHPGYFDEDEEDIADGVIETMPLSTLRQMLDFRCGYIAMHEPYARLLTREAIDRDEAMAVEELVQYDFTCEERQFARAHGGDLRLTEPSHLQRYGTLVGIDTLDPRDPYCGLAMGLLDPRTVFPVWGGTDLLEVYRVYEDAAPAIAGHYGGAPGSSEHARIAASLRRDGRKKKDLATARTERRTITEVWNRDHFAAFVDDEPEPLLRRKHGYRRVPITIVNGNFDLPAATSCGVGRDPETISTRWGEITVDDAAVDIAHRRRPYDWQRLPGHRIAEAVLGRQLTQVKWALDPPKVYEYDALTDRDPPDVGPLRPGRTITVPIPGKLTIVTPVIDPAAMAGLNMGLAANAQNGVLGQLASGAIPPQTSGSALNGMVDLGSAADAALVRLMQLFWRLRAEFRLYLRLHFGGMLGRTGERGVIAVPSSRAYAQTPLYRVTPDIIRRTGIDLEVEAHYFRPDVTTAQYLSTLRAPSAVTGLPLISDETARRKLRATADPDREAERIEDEQLLAQATIARARTIRRLTRERDQALAEGDDDSADDAQVAILQLQYLQEQDVLSGAAPPPQGAGMGMGAGQQLAPPAPPRPALPGTSLPDQGIGVGAEGGRPSGTPPPPMTPITGSPGGIG